MVSQGQPSSDGLVERGRERALIAERLAAAADGRGSLLRIVGAAGLGKTALLRDGARVAAERKIAVLSVTALELEQPSPFGVARRLLDRPLMALAPQERAQVLSGPAQVAAQHLLGLDDREAVPTDQAAMLSGLYWLVDGLAARSPLLVLVDDAQWADSDSLLFLKLLAERLADLPILLVVAMREVAPAGGDAALAGLLAHREGATLRLAGLSPTGVAALLGPEATESDVADASEITGGNPFLVIALADLLARSPERGSPLRDLVPDGVVDHVVHQLAMLPEEPRRLAEAVAVLEAAPLRRAAALAGLSPPEATAAAQSLREIGLMAAGRSLTFRHALLRTAVAAVIDPGRLGDLRRAAASLVAGEEGEQAAAALLVLTEGVADPATVALLRRVAATALAAGAPRSAEAMLRRAVEEPPSAELLPRVLTDLGIAQVHSADPACVATLERAIALSADPTLTAEASLAIAQAYNFAGHYERTADVLERALAGLGDSSDDLALLVEAAQVAAARQVPALVRGAQARMATRRDLTGATPGERLHLIQQTVDAVGTNQGEAVIRRLARRALEGAAPLEPEPYMWAVVCLALSNIGDITEARDHAQQGLDAAAAAGSVWGFIASTYLSAVARLQAGDLRHAEGDFRAVLDLIEGASGAVARRMATAGLLETLTAAGRIEDAIELSEGIEADVPGAIDTGSIQLLRARARAFQLHGQHAQALALAEDCGRRQQAVDIDSPSWCSWRSVAAEALLALGEERAAVVLLEQELALTEASGVAPAHGIALRLLGQAVNDRVLLTRSVELLAATEARLDHARSLVALGAAMRRDGQRKQARASLLAGRDLAARCGAALLVELADAELSAAGARPRRLAVSGADALTASELRVCELAATGLRNREIAQRLFVTPKTVEVHLSRSYRKLAITGRDELASALGGP